jgi:hypothetical protein
MNSPASWVWRAGLLARNVTEDTSDEALRAIAER